MKIIVNNQKEKEQAFTYCKVLKALDKDIRVFTIEDNKKHLCYVYEFVQFFFDNEEEKQDLIKQAKRHQADIYIIDEE